MNECQEYQFDLTFFTGVDFLEYLRIIGKLQSPHEQFEGITKLVQFAGEYSSTSIPSMMASEIMPFTVAFAKAVNERVMGEGDE